MTTLTFSPDSPLHHLGRDCLQHLINRLIPGLSSQGDLDDDAQQAHDQDALGLLESLNPRTPVQAAFAAQFLTAHYGSMACSRDAMDSPKGSRDFTRLHATAGSLARVMTQTHRALQRIQAPERASRGRPGTTAANEAPAEAGTATQRRVNPMPSESTAPAGPGDVAPRRFDPMSSENAMPAGAGHDAPPGNAATQAPDPAGAGDDASPGIAATRAPDPAGAGDTTPQRFDPMPSENAAPATPLRTWKDYARAERQRPMPSGNGTPDDPAQSGGPTQPAGQPLTLAVARPDKDEPDRSGRPIAYETMHRPDGTYWNEPPACWPGPSWLADRFPLSEKERLSLWGPKAWDELTQDMRLITWGYEHEPGVLEPAVLAALAAAGKNPGDYCSDPDLRRKRAASPPPDEAGELSPSPCG